MWAGVSQTDWGDPFAMYTMPNHDVIHLKLIY